MPLAAGSRFGPYEIVALIGEGGMGEVYKARDTRLDRFVAIKVLPEAAAGDRGRCRRFEQEARAVAAISHPNILAIYDVGSHPSEGPAQETLYLVTEYLEGETLRDRLASGALPVPVAAETAVQMARGLAAAHDRGSVHRDLKPANVFLTKDGHVKILDFGIAKLIAPKRVEAPTQATTAIDATEAGTTLGTMGYMSPEQIRGGSIDHRTDIFSFGCVLYEMLAGRRAFAGGTAADTAAATLGTDPPALDGPGSAVPLGLHEIVRRSLEKRPADRFASMAELASALQVVARGFSPDPETGGSEKSIVVLPFENLSPDPDNAYFADGLTEELIADLSKVRALRVISRTSAMMYKAAKKSAPAIARELNVRYVLEGSVRRAGNALRITAQLIDGSTDAHLWAEKYAGTLDDVFDLQERLSRRIVDGLRLSLTPEEDRELAARPIQDARAYDAWLRANQEAWSLTPGGFDRAFQHLNRALEIGGENALLHAGLGYLHAMAYDTGASHDAQTLAKAEAHAARALELDPALGHAHLSMGWVRYKRGDFPRGLRMFRLAADTDRSIDALLMTAFLLGEAGRIADARRFAEAAVAADPLNQLSGFARGGVEFLDGRFDEAALWFRKYVDEVAPGSPLLLWWLAQALAHAGRDAESMSVFEQVAGMGAGLFSDLSALYCLAARGDGEAVRRALEANAGLQDAAKTDEWYPNVIAVCLAKVGDDEGAIDWLERAVAWGFSSRRFLAELNPFLAPLRGHPRFVALMKVVHEHERAFP